MKNFFANHNIIFVSALMLMLSLSSITVYAEINVDATKVKETPQSVASSTEKIKGAINDYKNDHKDELDKTKSAVTTKTNEAKDKLNSLFKKVKEFFKNLMHLFVVESKDDFSSTYTNSVDVQNSNVASNQLDIISQKATDRIQNKDFDYLKNSTGEIAKAVQTNNKEVQTKALGDLTENSQDAISNILTRSGNSLPKVPESTPSKVVQKVKQELPKVSSDNTKGSVSSAIGNLSNLIH